MDLKVQMRKYWRFKGGIPSDKSITHRALVLATMAEGLSVIENYSDCLDCRATLKALEQLGSTIKVKEKKMEIKGNGLFGYAAPRHKLKAQNSGSTFKFLTGLLAGQRFNSFIDGDFSLRERPMDSILIPLKKMGAKISGKRARIFPPLRITGSNLNGINYRLPVYSAQLKTTLLIAALLADGLTVLSGKVKTRDHTERMLKYFGADIAFKDDKIYAKGLKKIKGSFLKINGDPSCASFLVTLAVLLPDAEVVLNDVNLNPSRIEYFNLLKKMGADIKIIKSGKDETGEPFGDICASSSQLRGIEIGGITSSLILDEVPLLALSATCANGETLIKDVKGLKFKECDRIEGTASILRKLGVRIETSGDSIKICGKAKLKGNRLKTFKDHRLVMMGALAGCLAEGESIIEDSEYCSISFPGFWKLFYGGRSR